MLEVKALLVEHARLTAFSGAAIVHLILFGIALSLPRPETTYDTITPVMVTLYEPPPPVLEPQPEPEPIADTAPVRDTSQPEAPIVSAPSTQLPVTSFTEAPDHTEKIVQPPSAPIKTPPSVSTDTPLMRAANILNRADCNRLTRNKHADCPRPYPFASAEASQGLRDPTAPVSIPDLQAFGPQGMAEKYLATRGWKPSMLGPGSADGIGAASLINLGTIDNSIFIDPMAEGAYNAQRIRNGQTPIWDRDIEKALKDARD